jgi:hypothetical protein
VAANPNYELIFPEDSLDRKTFSQLRSGVHDRLDQERIKNLQPASIGFRTHLSAGAESPWPDFSREHKLCLILAQIRES